MVSPTPRLVARDLEPGECSQEAELMGPLTWGTRTDDPNLAL